MRSQALLSDVFAARAHRNESNVSAAQPVTPRSANANHKQLFSVCSGAKTRKSQASFPLLIVTNYKRPCCLQAEPETDRSYKPFRSPFHEANGPLTPGRHSGCNRLSFQRCTSALPSASRDESKGSLIIGEDATHLAAAAARKNAAFSISKLRADIKDKLGCCLEQGSTPKVVLKPNGLQMMLKGLTLKYRKRHFKCCD